MELKFRNLTADEIEVRIGTGKKDSAGNITGASYLLYKNARVDMALLDEVVGAFNWQREHEFKDGKLYCKVSIYDDIKNQWVSKEDVGVESNTEAEKGQASDSFKRACFNWGIGRELYTAPFIWVKPYESEDLKFTKLYVKTIEYTDNKITKLIIEDSKGNTRFSMGALKEDVSLSYELVQLAKENNIDLDGLKKYLGKNSVVDLTKEEIENAIKMKKERAKKC